MLQEKPESSADGYLGPERRHGWRFEKTINISNLLTVVALSLPVIAWWLKLDHRVAENAQSIRHISEVQRRDQDRVEVMRTEWREDMRAINEKLDKLINRI